MMSLPFLSGFTQYQWENAINLMLEKDPGIPRVNRLRIIVIVEGDMSRAIQKGWNFTGCPPPKGGNNGLPLSFQIKWHSVKQ
eukprot:13621459-Ditylum_brightwellii.AAC.1